MNATWLVGLRETVERAPTFVAMIVIQSGVPRGRMRATSEMQSAASPYDVSSVVAIHGWIGGLETFSRLEASASGRWSLVCVDLPGFADGRPPADVDEVVDAVIEQAERAAPPRVLLGYCSGVHFGLLAAVRRPALFSRLVLVDAFARMPWYFRTFLVPVLGPIAYYSTFANPLGRFVTNRAVNDAPAGATNLTAAFQQAPHAVARRYLRLLGGLRTLNAYAALRQPVDFFCGSRTFGAVAEGLDAWRRVLPQMRVHAIEGVGHGLLDEAPDEVLRILEQPTSATVAAPAAHDAGRAGMVVG